MSTAKRLAPRDAVNKVRADNNGQVVLVLQGGGALGSYQAGVYQALHEAGIEPDWIIGTSIGAINASLIAGNAPENRLARLREFWQRMEHHLGSAYAASWARDQVLGSLGGRTAQEALDLGITHFDTAALYGFGANETLVGEVLRNRPPGVRVTRERAGRTGRARAGSRRSTSPRARRSGARRSRGRRASRSRTA